MLVGVVLCCGAHAGVPLLEVVVWVCAGWRVLKAGAILVCVVLCCGAHAGVPLLEVVVWVCAGWRVLKAGAVLVCVVPTYCGRVSAWRRAAQRTKLARTCKP